MLPVQLNAELVYRAEVAELADARGSGPRTRKGVGVRVPSSAPNLFVRSIRFAKTRQDDTLRRCEPPSCVSEKLTQVSLKRTANKSARQQHESRFWMEVADPYR